MIQQWPMMRGLNLNGVFDAVRRQDQQVWGGPALIDTVAAAGFDTVRLPIRWTDHLDAAGRVDAQFFTRVDLVVDQLLDRGLNVIIDVHTSARSRATPRARRASCTVCGARSPAGTVTGPPDSDTSC